MNMDHVKVQIENALYLMQLITEDLEDNFIGNNMSNSIKARATVTISSLAVLDDYLRHIVREVEA